MEAAWILPEVAQGLGRADLTHLVFVKLSKYWDGNADWSKMMFLVWKNINEKIVIG